MTPEQRGEELADKWFDKWAPAIRAGLGAEVDLAEFAADAIREAERVASEAATLRERERCATVAEEWAARWNRAAEGESLLSSQQLYGSAGGAMTIAAAIRRGTDRG